VANGTAGQKPCLLTIGGGPVANAVSYEIDKDVCKGYQPQYPVGEDVLDEEFLYGNLFVGAHFLLRGEIVPVLVNGRKAA
jgi:hypothetical protein